MTDLPQSVIDRFHVKYVPEPNTGCWIWDAAMFYNGYGAFQLAKKKTVLAHRCSYEIHKGPIPDGLHLDHLCRVRSCVNPDHLEAVTPQENISRGETGVHQRERTHCPHGHPYSGANLGTTKNGGRYCRTCARLKARKRNGYQGKATRPILT